MTAFAIKTLLADPRKLLIAILGVAFSLVLVNVQGGLFIGMIRKSTLLIDYGGADVWVGHRGVQNADITADIPVAWLHRIRAVDGVERADAYVVAMGMLELRDGTFEGVLVVGSDPVSRLGGAWSFAEGNADRLQFPDAISIDRLDSPRLGDPAIGDLLEINGNRARVMAKTDGIVGFITTPYVFTTTARARQFTNTPPRRCSYFLAKVKPGHPIDEVIAQIRARLPHADVYATDDFSWATRMYWIVRTGLGVSFGSSTFLGLLVGLVMVAQSLYSFVVDHLENFAALKAIGATDRQIGGILFGQGLIIAVIGCVIGHATSWLIWALVSTPKLTIAFTPALMIAATILAVMLCVVSSLIPLGRIRRVDPVSVLQG